ncbi:endonuclease/exonuclease/phosphatase [Seiridium cupressi]
MYNEKPWADRAQPVVDQLTGAITGAPLGVQTIIGLQEVLYTQLQDLRRGLGDDWAYIGVGRDDGKQAGEFNPIFYRKSDVRLLYNVTKWLSPTPNKPSYGWKASSRRIVNVGVFERMATAKRFISANTQLDDVSMEARTKGAQVALNVIKDVQKTWGPLAMSLTGDFNSQPGSQDAYATVKNSGYLAEVYTTAKASQRFGEYNTYTGFDPAKQDQVSTRIDYVWLGPVAEKRWSVVRYEVLSSVQKGFYISDHRAVVSDVKIVV